MIVKRLYKSSSDKVISGVLGGLGNFLNIDPIILRLFYVLLAFRAFSSFFIIYILASIIIPKDDGIIYQENNNSTSKDNTSLIMGISLIIVGSFLLLKIFLPPWDINIISNLNIVFRRIFRFWPVLLIVLGIYIIFNQKKDK